MSADDDKCEEHHTTLFAVFLPDRPGQSDSSDWLISQRGNISDSDVPTREGAKIKQEQYETPTI